MTPEAAGHLEKAAQCLDRARIILTAQVPEVAAREAYLAAFHAAQALISERLGGEAKTHRGVHAQFARLTRDESSLDQELRQFLPKAYDMKALADYEVPPYSDISAVQAESAIETAVRFIDFVAALLA